ASIDFTFGDATITGAATFRILNEDANNGFGGGSIAGDASIFVSTSNTFSAPTLLAEINNLGGFIGGESSIEFSGGILNTVHGATFEILEDASTETDSSISISAESISVGGSLIARITDLQTSFDLEKVTVQATGGDITVGNQLLVDGNVT